MAEWKTIEVKGFSFSVCDDGTIVRPRRETSYEVVRRGKHQKVEAVFAERRLSPCKNRVGYLEVATRGDGRPHKFAVHRLVAQAFAPGYSPDLHVNHINGDKTDNRVENLEWVTKGENTKHAWRNNLIPLVGESHPGSKLTNKRVSYIKKLLQTGVSASSAAVVAGVSVRMICKIRDGKAWSHIEAAK
ncbi:HNH endonuclease signature motif containing protein [Rhizobium sophoriradicis]|uniref:HNH nuclease domain-containing protein n=1 Tax=Rhizobium sophoriradicis TaxID=1535245 RepID=A0A2A5KVZ5_9HYPH|nr:HNH endonuclease signature motif containing protein [Rhizobium sophoriradicis]PCK81228.1 hypothetical protein CPT34_11130 [Rhizobium sophoriradicis]